MYQKKVVILHAFFAESKTIQDKHRQTINMTKAELVNEIAINTGFDKRTIDLVVDGFTEGVKDALSNGENVYIRGFGSFIVKTRKAKVARNIRSKTSIQVPEHNIAAFKAGAEFKAAVRNVAKK